MGMFDRIHCQYDVGTGFWNRTLQTKGLDNLMDEYWLDPIGQLFIIDYSGTQDWEPDSTWGYKMVPNGSKGKVTPVYYHGTLLVYPEKWDCKYAPYPVKLLTFTHGLCQNVIDPPRPEFP